MKRTSLINLSIIAGLLALCVMTLIAVYAMEPESSSSEPKVLLFEDRLNVLDEAKWEHLVSTCDEDGSQFHYSTADGERSGYTGDDVLHVHPTVKEEKDLRKARDITLNMCPPCTDPDNSDIKCVPTVYKIQTRNSFLVQNGRIELRAKLPKGNWTTYSIGMTPNATDSKEQKASEGFNLVDIINNGNERDTKDIRLSLGLETNQTTVQSNITSDEFHVFEVEWSDNKITFKIDSQEIFEKTKTFPNVRDRNKPTENENLVTSWMLKEPFYLSLSAGVEEKHFQNSDQIRSSSNSTNEKYESSVGDILEIDYIRMFKIS